MKLFGLLLLLAGTSAWGADAPSSSTAVVPMGAPVGGTYVVPAGAISPPAAVAPPPSSTGGTTSAAPPAPTVSGANPPGPVQPAPAYIAPLGSPPAQPGASPNAQPGSGPKGNDACCMSGGRPMAPAAVDAPKDSSARSPQGGGMDRGPAGMRDPTTMTPRFRDAMRQMVPPSAKGGSSVAGSSLAKLRLVGKGIGGGKPPSALLEFNDQIYLVRQGSQISLAGQGREPLTIRVESITESGVQLVVLPQNERLFLN